LIIFSSSVSHQIKITFCDKIEIRAIDSDVGAEAIESLEIKSENDGIPTEIGLNAEYAIKTLQSMTDEEIMIEYDTPIKALVLEGENHKCIIMPVRIN
jgi:DNA polymerase III sliding clamp (beta) subunit (PCNA family)